MTKATQTTQRQARAKQINAHMRSESLYKLTRREREMYVCKLYTQLICCQWETNKSAICYLPTENNTLEKHVYNMTTITAITIIINNDNPL